MSTLVKKKRKDPIPKKGIAFNITDNAWWTDIHNWSELICPFPFAHMTDEMITKYWIAATQYARDLTGSVPRIPIGMDIALAILARKPDLMRVCWGPRITKVDNAVNKLAGVSLGHAEYSNPFRFMVGLQQAGYSKIMLRGGISSGAVQAKDSDIDVRTRKVDICKHLRRAGNKVDLRKRSVTVSYRRILPGEHLDAKLREAASPAEKAALHQDAFFTMLEVLQDLQIRRVAALSNAAESAKPNGILFPLDKQKSTSGVLINNEDEWESTANGYMQWDLFLPKCNNGPDDVTAKVLSYYPKSYIGPVSTYNPNMDIYSDDEAVLVKRSFCQMVEGEYPDYMTRLPPPPEDYKEPTRKQPCTRFSKVVSWDESDPTKAPVLAPVTDLRPYINLGNDYVVPAFFVHEGPYQLATAKGGWKPKNSIVEIMLFDPIYMPVMNAELRNTIADRENEMVTELPSANDIYGALGSFNLLEGPRQPLAIAAAPSNSVPDSTNTVVEAPIVAPVIEDQDLMDMELPTTSKKRPHSDIQDSNPTLDAAPGSEEPALKKLPAILLEELPAD